MDILATVKDVMEAPSCCAELKEACQKYLDAVGTDAQADAAAALVAELEEDVCSIDDVYALFTSEQGAEIFGAEAAAAMAKQAEDVKAAGGDTCFCPACTAGKKVLENKDLL